MSESIKARSANVSQKVAQGAGLAGCHGRMCDAFRANVLRQFMTGANWVAHPLVAGIPDFEVKSERYCLHIDPANHVPVTSWFPTVSWYHSPNGTVDMPVVWTRSWGDGFITTPWGIGKM